MAIGRTRAIVALALAHVCPMVRAFSSPGYAAAGIKRPSAYATPRARPVMDEVVVDLGEGYGRVAADFTPMFEDSEIFIARYTVPFDLNIEPRDGRIVVTKDDDQLKEGDVVRATSTFSVKMQTDFGLLPAAKKTKALFDVSGKEWDDVVAAFIANRKSVTNDVVLVVERPGAGNA